MQKCSLIHPVCSVIIYDFSCYIGRVLRCHRLVIFFLTLTPIWRLRLRPQCPLESLHPSHPRYIAIPSSTPSVLAWGTTLTRSPCQEWTVAACWPPLCRLCPPQLRLRSAAWRPAPYQRAWTQDQSWTAGPRLSPRAPSPCLRNSVQRKKRPASFRTSSAWSVDWKANKIGQPGAALPDRMVMAESHKALHVTHVLSGFVF